VDYAKLVKQTRLIGEENMKRLILMKDEIETTKLQIIEQEKAKALLEHKEEKLKEEYMKHFDLVQDYKK
jgi:hypothetical protein